MITKEQKEELRKLIELANGILSNYKLRLSYDKYSVDENIPLIPTLTCLPKNVGEVTGAEARLSLEILEVEASDIKKLAFYISGVSFEARDISESMEKMEALKLVLADIKALNTLGLWTSDELTSLS